MKWKFATLDTERGVPFTLKANSGAGSRSPPAVERQDVIPGQAEAFLRGWHEACAGVAMQPIGQLIAALI
jgi:hypothetical protein